MRSSVPATLTFALALTASYGADITAVPKKAITDWVIISGFENADCSGTPSMVEYHETLPGDVEEPSFFTPCTKTKDGVFLSRAHENGTITSLSDDAEKHFPETPFMGIFDSADPKNVAAADETFFRRADGKCLPDLYKTGNGPYFHVLVNETAVTLAFFTDDQCEQPFTGGTTRVYSADGERDSDNDYVVGPNSERNGKVYLRVYDADHKTNWPKSFATKPSTTSEENKNATGATNNSAASNDSKTTPSDKKSASSTNKLTATLVVTASAVLLATLL